MTYQGDGPTSHLFYSQRTRLHYVDWGNSESPALLLIHGGCDHARSWDWVARALQPAWHVVAPDLRGHGDSAWSTAGNYSFPSFVYDLAELVDGLGNLPVTIVGHSLGGNVALQYTALFPDKVRKVVAIEGLGPPPSLRAERAAIPPVARLRRWIADRQDAARRSPRRYEAVEDMVLRMRAENSNLSEERARHLTIHGVRRNEDRSWSWKFDNLYRVLPWMDLSGFQIELVWEAIECPTLLMCGANSWDSNPEHDGRLLHFRNARVVEVQDSGHWLHHDRTTEFLTAITSFLESDG